MISSISHQMITKTKSGATVQATPLFDLVDPSLQHNDSNCQLAAFEAATTPPEAREAAPLVITRKSASHVGKTASNRARLERYRRQEIARRLKPGSPVAGCLRRVSFDYVSRRQYSHVVVKQSLEDGHRYTANLWRCKSTWDCPNCQWLVACNYLDRMLAVLDRPDNKQKFAYGLMTLTASHNVSTDCADFVSKLKDAKRRFMSGRWSQAFRNRWHIRGYFVAPDITITDNGFHLHFHALVVADKGRFDVLLQDGSQLWIGSNLNDHVCAEIFIEAAHRWIDCCDLAGLHASLSHGFHIEGANKSVADYLAKMGMEVTLSPGKQSSGYGVTVQQLLDKYDQGDIHAGMMWKDITNAMKGSALVKASSGLWELLGENEPTSDDLLEEETESDQVVATFDKLEWYQLLRNGLRQEWHEAVDSGLLDLDKWCKRNGFVSLVIKELPT